MLSGWPGGTQSSKQQKQDSIKTQVLDLTPRFFHYAMQLLLI